ncbi:MAG: hypothetical protein ABFE16_00805 [Armatimonadia bacterium]
MTNTFKPGDKVRRTRPHMNGLEAYGPGFEFIVDRVTHNTLWAKGDSTYGHNVANVELVTPARAFKVGDIVKLTGIKWGDGFPPSAGTTHEIIEVFGGSHAKIDTGTPGNSDVWYVYPAGDRYYAEWGAEIVTPESDATGYPVGTPRAEKAVPETADIKAEFAGGDPAKLALFNRWYERELEEAREDASTMAFVNGRREGFKAGWDQRGELEAADLADWERELLGLNPAPKPVVVQSARDFVDALPVGTRIRSLEAGSEYTRIPDGLIATKVGGGSYFRVGHVFAIRNVTARANFYEIIE